MNWKGEESYFYGSSLYVDRTFLKGIPRRRQQERSGLDNRRLVFFRSDTLGRGLENCFLFLSSVQSQNRILINRPKKDCQGPQRALT
jgi:hypothetical protein